MLNWKVTEKGPAGTFVMMYGDVNEAASFGELKMLKGRVVFDFAGIRRINSFGVRELLRFLEGLAKGASLEAERCSPAVVTQLNMLPEFSKQLKVRSIIAPMECPSCFAEREIKVEINGLRASVPGVRCDDCGTEMSLSEPEDRYFAFLEDGA